MTLDDYLESADARPWAWGTVDCMMRCADWCAAQSGGDPGASFRGRYASAAGAWRIILEAGGMVPLIAAQIEPCGWRRTDDPDSGDIGVVLAQSAIDGKIKEVGALRYGPWWSVRGEDFVAYVVCDAVAAWTLSKG